MVYPNRVRIKARKVRHSTRHLHARHDVWQDRHTSFGEFDANVQGCLNHVRHADSRGPRAHVLAPFVLPPGLEPKYRGRWRW